MKVKDLFESKRGWIGVYFMQGLMGQYASTPEELEEWMLAIGWMIYLVEKGEL